MAVLRIVEAIIGKLAADEIKAWLPVLNQKILRLAVLRLPGEERERYLEEWEADLIDIPTEPAKFICSIGRFIAALRMARIHRADSESSVAHKVKLYIMARHVRITNQFHMNLTYFLWMSLSEYAGIMGGDKFTIAKDESYTRLYRFVKLSPEIGECPLWVSCVLTVCIFFQTLNLKWLRSAKRKLLEA